MLGIPLKLPLFSIVASYYYCSGQIFIFFYWQVKRVSNVPKNATFEYCMQKV